MLALGAPPGSRARERARAGGGGRRHGRVRRLPVELRAAGDSRRPRRPRLPRPAGERLGRLHLPRRVAGGGGGGQGCQRARGRLRELERRGRHAGGAFAARPPQRGPAPRRGGGEAHALRHPRVLRRRRPAAGAAAADAAPLLLPRRIGRRRRPHLPARQRSDAPRPQVAKRAAARRARRQDRRLRPRRRRAADRLDPHSLLGARGAHARDRRARWTARGRFPQRYAHPPPPSPILHLQAATAGWRPRS